MQVAQREHELFYNFLRSGETLSIIVGPQISDAVQLHHVQDVAFRLKDPSDGAGVSTFGVTAARS